MNLLQKAFTQKTKVQMSPMGILTTPVNGKKHVFQTQLKCEDGTLTRPVTVHTTPKSVAYS